MCISWRGGGIGERGERGELTLIRKERNIFWGEKGLSGGKRGVFL